MKQGPWLNGWSDLVANLQVNMNCVKLLDVQGNGQNNLVVAEQSGRLVSYKNTHIDWETRVQGMSIALAYFYTEQQSATPQPYISVGCGGCVYVYRVFKSFYQFKIPTIPMHQLEEQAWKSYIDNTKLDDLLQSLTNLNQSGVELSYKSQEILCYANKTKQQELAQLYCDNLQIDDVVTCLDILKKVQEEDYSPGQLVIGTELKNIYIVNTDLATIAKKYTLPGTPIMICVFSENQEVGRIAILVRQGSIYFIGTQIETYKVDLASKPITMVRQTQLLFVASMDRVVQCYRQQQKTHQIQFQYNILALESLEFGRGKPVKGILVALDNKTIQFYQESQLINTISLETNVVAMKFGQFGREDGFLVIINYKGGIDTKILQRQFQSVQAQPINQDLIQPISIPKKTKLYVELASRERNQGAEILRAYQYDVQRMRLKTAQTYNAILQNEELAPQLSQNAQLRFTASVEGLGPQFKIICCVENLSNVAIHGVYVAYQYNQQIHKLIKWTQQLTYLIPKHQRKFDILVQSVSESGQGDQMKIQLFQEQTSLINVVIAIPMSDVE